MSDTELKFGPEWMRQLSHGGGLAGSAAPPCHPSLPANKNKPAVAEHRYSKEKMLELCARMEAPPEHLLNDPAALCGDQDCTVPLAFTSLSQDEQRMWQRNINSDSAMRFIANGNAGRGGGVSGGGGGGGGGGLVATGGGALGGVNSLGGVGGSGPRGRGGSMDRGRGRARGGPGQYYMRGLSYEEDGETGARGGGSRELAPPGIAMRRGGGFERSSSLSGGVGLSGGGPDGRSGLGAWGAPPNITSDHPSGQMSGSGYHASHSLDHSSAARGSLQGEDRGGASSPRKEQSRAPTNNWRSRDLSSGTGDSAPVLQDHWRSSSSIGSSLASRQQQDKWSSGRLNNSGGWRPRDAGEESGGYAGSYSSYGASRGRGQQRSKQTWDNRRNWGDEDRLPEWAMDLSHEPARGGSFDASGAFHAPAWSSADDDHGISNGFSVNSYSNSNNYPMSGGGGGYSHSSGNFSSGGGSLIATAGGLRARHKSGSVGPGELLTPESSVPSDVPSLDSAAAGSAAKDSSSRGTSREKNNSSVMNGFHRNTLSRKSNDSLHSSDPQKRLSEALEVHGDEGPARPMMNGYGGDSRSDSRSSSHDGSNSPLSSEKTNSQANLESSRSVPSMLDSPRSRTSISEEKSSATGGSSSENVQSRSETASTDQQQQQLRQPGGHLEHSKSEPAVPSGLRASNSSRESESAVSRHSLQSQLLQPSSSLPSSKEEKLREPELEHMELNADDLVAKLVDEEPKACEPVPSAARRPMNITPPAGFLPIPERPPADPHQWYYTDPQQEVQGPFSGLIMTSWYEGGYFGDDLLLRRDCDDKFAKLGDLKRVFGRVPFAPGPPVPPLKMSKLRDSQTPHDAEKDLIRKQAAEKEAFEQALQAYNLEKRIYDHQQDQRRAHVLSALSSLDGWDSLPPETQRNLFMQNILRLGSLPEPVAPTAPSFLLNPSSASAAAALSLLTLPQQVHHQLPQASSVASTDASSLQQQHGANSSGGSIATSHHLNTTLASASIAAAAAAAASSSAAGVGVVQQLQNLPQHSILAAASSNTSSSTNTPHTPHLQHLSSSTIPEQQQQQQQQQPQQSTLGVARDPIRELVDQMSSVTTGQQQKSASPLTTLGVTTDSTPVMPPNTSVLPTLAQPTSLHQLLLKLQSDATSTNNTVPTLPLLPQQLLNAQSLASGLQIPLPSSSSATAGAGLNSQITAPPAAPAEDSRPAASLLGTAQQPQPKEDVIQSFMEQLTKMHLQQEQASAQVVSAATSQAAEAPGAAPAAPQPQAAAAAAKEPEAEQNDPAPPEEDKRRSHQAKKLQDEKKKPDSRPKKEEENASSKKQEERRKLLEEQKKKEQEEEQKKKALEAKRKEEEKKKKLKQQEEANRRQEEKRRQEEENKRKAEERRREQQLRKQQQQQQEEMRRVALEEERKRMNQIEQEELAEMEAARMQQQQAAWGNAAAAAAPAANGAQRTPSLAQIQKVQLEKEKLERERWLKEEEARRQELQREAAEKKKASSMTLKWANKQESGSSVKSLLQIQAEEEKEIKKRQTRELQENKGNSNNTGASSGSGRLWGANNQPLSWASRASCNSAPPPSLPNGTPGSKSWSENSGSSAWTGAAGSLGSGFWDTAGSDKASGKTAASVAAARAPAKPGVVKGSSQQASAAKQNKNSVKQNLNNKLNMQSNANNAAKIASKKKGKEEEAVKKIFSENVGGPDNEFTDWCNSSLVKLKVTANIDVPTFISFLRDVESPYEVHDYIRSYLGDNAEVREFARGYLERRSEVLNATRQKNLSHDNILGPAPAINPASDAFQEAKKGKQKGKKKVQKVDSGLLGFTVGGKGGDGGGAQ